MLKTPDFIVSCEWLNRHLDNDELIILDATIPMVTVKKSEEQISFEAIPTARFFDLKGNFSDSDAEFPNTMVRSEIFEKEAQELGISQNSCIIIYDRHGVYSSPRAWWMFRSMGFSNVAVLNGGLPEWKTLGYETESNYTEDFVQGDFKAVPVNDMFVDYQHVLDSIENNNMSIVDARSKGRFEGTAPEPRAGVRSGHIPNSNSLPYTSLLDQHKLKSKEELTTLFNNSFQETESLVFSCGTGITACVLALGASLAGKDEICVYDGSWTEWGSLLDLPVEL